MNNAVQKNAVGTPFLSSELKNQNASPFANEQIQQVKGEKYVVFCLGADFFAVSSEKVSEVVQMLSVTRLPNVPRWLIGIADLRGTIISVVNLRNLLGNANAPVAQRTKFIVLKSQNLASPIALAVDRISEIISIPINEIQFSQDAKAQYLMGKTTNKSSTLSLLDADKLLSALTI